MGTASETVFVLEDDPSVRKALLRLVRSTGYVGIGFSSAEDFLHREPCEGPACVLLDFKLSGLDGLEVQDTLRIEDADLPIIFLTGCNDVAVCARAIKNGAIDYFPKPVDDEKLTAAIKLAMSKHKHALRERKWANNVREHLHLLTPREYEVMVNVIAGSLNKQTAQVLNIAEKTVKVHRSHVMEKLNVQSVPDLVRICARVGIEPASRFKESVRA